MITKSIFNELWRAVVLHKIAKAGSRCKNNEELYGKITYPNGCVSVA